MDTVLTSPPVVIVALVVVVGLGVVALQKYQRCPHCGHVVRRALRGWLRCATCGRQYRRGLRVR